MSACTHHNSIRQGRSLSTLLFGLNATWQERKKIWLPWSPLQNEGGGVNLSPPPARGKKGAVAL